MPSDNDISFALLEEKIALLNNKIKAAAANGPSGEYDRLMNLSRAVAEQLNTLLVDKGGHFDKEQRQVIDLSLEIMDSIDLTNKGQAEADLNAVNVILKRDIQ